MIEIRNAEGLSLQLPAGQSITVEQASGWLAGDELPGSFSYPISAPLNENNERFLKYAYRPASTRPVMELPVNVQLQGVLYRKCLFAYRINEGKIDGYLKIDAGEVWPQLRDKQIGDVLPEYLHLGDGIFSGSYISLKDRLKQIAQMPPGTYPFTFFPIKNDLQIEEAFTADKLSGFVRTGYLNGWSGSDFRVDTGSVFGHLISPQLYLWYVFEQIMLAAGYRLAGDFFAEPEVQRLTILNLTAMHQASGFNALAGNLMYPKLHLPDLSVSDFLKAVKARYGLIYSFNSTDKICTVRRYADIWKNRRAIQDWREFQLAGYGIEEPSGKGFTLEEYIDPADELFKMPDPQGNLRPGIPKTYVLGKGGEPVSLQVGTTQMTYIPAPYSTSARWMVPVVRQPGTILDPAYKQSDRYIEDNNIQNAVGLRLLSYRGLVDDSQGGRYPLGTSDVRNGRQEVIGQVAPRMSGTYGGWNTGLKLYYDFLDKNRKVTVDLLIPAQRLSGLQLHEPLMCSFNGQNVSLLPGQVRAEAPGSSGKLTTELEAYTVPDGADIPRITPDPLVYVELIQTVLESRTGVIGIVHEIRSLTVKVWKDAARSQPVSAGQLPLSVNIFMSRTKRFYTTDRNTAKSYPDRLEQQIKTYTITGAVQQLESQKTVLMQGEPPLPEEGKIPAGWSTPIYIQTTSFYVTIGDDYDILI
ncbi:hypothetical protein [Arsenicibacter rosenii]|uniref:Uncharacterized protein n=1 Tax=Arsenicibacter rosenii TaxID=1750698 RepID=A0A1S2VFU3_9BACT|nr:hypothetical protein [Arsenicibacter rosenii]OIN57621.1 hypothetical protein BLX24_19280 [Arsenicibacter rosenii]